MIQLSILTPAVPKRMLQISDLCEEIGTQIKVDGLDVEHLVFIDNKRRTVGEKRDALLRMARGRYVAFVDDDDWISKDYCRQIVKAAESGPAVVTFLQESTVNGNKGIIEFKLGNPNETFMGVPDDELGAVMTRRNAWHVCAWRRTLAVQSNFPASNYGEDWAFASKLCALPDLKEVHIPKVLHYYRHDSNTTEAPPPR